MFDGSGTYNAGMPHNIRDAQYYATISYPLLNINLAYQLKKIMYCTFDIISLPFYIVI